MRTTVGIGARRSGFATFARPSSGALACGFLGVADARATVTAEIGALVDFAFVARVARAALALRHPQLIHCAGALKIISDELLVFDSFIFQNETTFGSATNTFNWISIGFQLISIGL